MNRHNPVKKKDVHEKCLVGQSSGILFLSEIPLAF